MRNVILVSLDTLRADRLDAYGYPRGTSPNIAALARRSIVFERAQAQSSQTAPSHASLLTSRYVGVHGIVNVHGAHAEFPTLPAKLVTLAELLSGKPGFRTAAFVSGGNLTRHMGLQRGFATWNEKNEDFQQRLALGREWLQQRDDAPFFLLLHTYQVHAPYVPPPEEAARFTDGAYVGPLRARFERYTAMSPEEAWAGLGEDYWEGVVDFTEQDVKYLSDLYDAEIAYTDSTLRKLLEVALAEPLAGSTALILVSDHGEEFKDHGKHQHDQVFEELVHVPLLIRLPSELEAAGWKGRVAEPVELVDVAPTIADLVGADWAGAGWQGTSLVAAMAPAPERSTLPAERPQFSELTLIGQGPKTYRTVTCKGWKYIHGHQVDLDQTWEWLFDLRSDPHEAVNLMDSAETEAQRMKAELMRLLAMRREQDREQRQALGEQATGTLSEETRAELEQLGYVGGQPR